MSIEIIKLDERKIALYQKTLLDENGYPRCLPARIVLDAIASLGYQDWIGFCYRTAIYQYPTQELVDWLKDQITEVDGQALEIGSGDNRLAQYLGIRGTDNYCQQHPSKRLHYANIRQKTTCTLAPELTGIEKLDGLAAIFKYKPRLVIGSWITPLWDEKLKQGNKEGVDYQKLLSACEKFIMVGNETVHEDVLAAFNHYNKIHISGLISRAAYYTHNCIYVWSNNK